MCVYKDFVNTFGSSYTTYCDKKRGCYDSACLILRSVESGRFVKAPREHEDGASVTRTRQNGDENSLMATKCEWEPVYHAADGKRGCCLFLRHVKVVERAAELVRSDFV